MDQQKPIKGEWAIERTIRINQQPASAYDGWPRRHDFRMGARHAEESHP
jgi:hypothetical protein